MSYLIINSYHNGQSVHNMLITGNHQIDDLILMSLNYSDNKLNCDTRCSVNLKSLLLSLVHMLAVLSVKLTRQEKFNQLNIHLAQ